MITSKLPNLGVSIFSQMSALANEHNATNLSQGFPNFDCDPFLKQQVNHYVNSGLNQYAPMAGLPQLQQAIANLVKLSYNRDIDAATDVTVTSGATEALFVALQTLVSVGDEVIVFDPAYDSYEPAVNMAGGKCVHIPLLPPSYAIDWAQVEQAITPKTKAIVINSPHNPTGSVLGEQDINALKDIISRHDIHLISDEVYEHIVFDGITHHSILRYPELAERSFVISSFGKTFHVTGWKVGYCVAPKALTEEFRKIHQYVTFSTVTPVQMAISDTINKHPELVSGLGAFYQRKRDVLREAVYNGPFKILPCHGTYFQLLDYTGMSDLNDVEFCHWLTKTHKIATIPLTVFYQTPPDSKVIRVCFAKDEPTLQQAGAVLCQI
jgi:methionine aminotransferase